MANLRVALIFEDDTKFVELAPMVLKDLITKLLEAGKTPQEVYDSILKELEALTFQSS